MFSAFLLSPLLDCVCFTRYWLSSWVICTPHNSRAYQFFYILEADETGCTGWTSVTFYAGNGAISSLRRFLVAVPHLVASSSLSKLSFFFRLREVRTASNYYRECRYQRLHHAAPSLPTPQLDTVTMYVFLCAYVVAAVSCLQQQQVAINMRWRR